MRKLFDGFVLIMIALVTTVTGQVVVFEGSIGIAQTSGKVGENISVDTTGVFAFPSVDAEVIVVGDVLYWDATAGKVTLDSDTGANIRAGVSWTAKGAGVVAIAEVKIG